MALDITREGACGFCVMADLWVHRIEWPNSPCRGHHVRMHFRNPKHLDFKKERFQMENDRNNVRPILS